MLRNIKLVVVVQFYILEETFTALVGLSTSSTRNKREVWGLNNIVSIFTGRDGYEYLGYGCYCGVGGYGEPLDEVDKCCLDHDICYNEMGCKEANPAFHVAYKHAKSATGDAIVQCTDKVGSCEYNTCVCDRKFGHCLKGKQFNTDYLMGRIETSGFLEGATEDRLRLCGTTGVSAVHKDRSRQEAHCSAHGYIAKLASTYKKPKSIRRVDEDSLKLTRFKHCAVDIAHSQAFQPSLVAALLSKLLDPDSIITKLFPQLSADVDLTCGMHSASVDDCTKRVCAFINDTLLAHVRSQYDEDTCATNSLNAQDTGLQEALFRMAGELNDDDTRIEFVEDVAARAKRFKTLFGWRCPAEARADTAKADVVNSVVEGTTDSVPGSTDTPHDLMSWFGCMSLFGWNCDKPAAAAAPEDTGSALQIVGGDDGGCRQTSITRIAAERARPATTPSNTPAWQRDNVIDQQPSNDKASRMNDPKQMKQVVGEMDSPFGVAPPWAVPGRPAVAREAPLDSATTVRQSAARQRHERQDAVALDTARHLDDDIKPGTADRAAVVMAGSAGTHVSTVTSLLLSLFVSACFM